MSREKESCTLRKFVDEVATNRRTITVYAPEPDEALAEHFETRGVTVAHEPLPADGSGGFVVVTADGEFVGSVPRRIARRVVSPVAADLGTGAEKAHWLPMNLLADTTFVSFDRAQLLAASREIEDRAYRRARGTLRTGFQSLSRVPDQRVVYDALVEKPDLDVHIYGRPDVPTGSDREAQLPDATIHAEDVPEIRRFWFIVYDGGGDDRQACALLAEEVDGDPGSFRGFWTYDPETVADLDDYLDATY
ncbi:DICT sensory domain-containing protein [Halorussus litoreus]|uniref:DICT sensory domain-containing protein n=1 Tax=Halorussus litoreus TaxID=1710536 RepID=UPI000E23D5DF|nr:DICT sensory domain-containing protein [Halorussus litoreus]